MSSSSSSDFQTCMMMIFYLRRESFHIATWIMKQNYRKVTYLPCQISLIHYIIRFVSQKQNMLMHRKYFLNSIIKICMIIYYGIWNWTAYYWLTSLKIFVTSIIHTELDPVNFITLPQYSFAAAFRNCQVHLLQEVEMYQFFEQGIRGGMCFVNRHYTLADNETKFIAYWDENNLYGNALRQSLPCSNFTWLTQVEIENINWLNINVDDEYGYTLCCDLHYPTNIHDETQDFPLAPEMDFVTSEMLTPFMQQQWQKRCEGRGESVEKVFQTEKKLLMTCRDKKSMLYISNYFNFI